MDIFPGKPELASCPLEILVSAKVLWALPDTHQQKYTSFTLSASLRFLKGMGHHSLLHQLSDISANA